ncbi:MAG TPA: VPLPA-CTERM sorting domain-containing protein [Paraburkholderia sp.]|uniref:VPLPA-CTERM sorting domain-containing protein n=1 Tax=Paraburkholderia sp. TaxID=1926495 RepID=UPI002B481F9C|nr:VPLPA-CTERM sorting domain-containing protein [Paraburkholderia sp.]HKR46164.1 VPLPA-CTERM sorting domain-containing protein [Paraburkholderia sp.]
MRNMLVKSVAAVLAMAAAGAANAAIDTPHLGGNGELFLTIWDPTVGNEASFNIGLNLNINSFTGNSGFVLSNVFSDSTFQQYFGAGSAGGSNLGNTAAWRYNVVAASNSADQSGLLFTQVGGGFSGLLNGATDNAANATDLYQVALGSCDSCGTDVKASPKYAGDNWGNNFAGAAAVINNAAGVGGTLNFYRAVNNTAPDYINDASSPATLTQLGTWVLSSAGNGTLTYSPVPLPAAAWLLGSGLIGLFGIGRRREQAV